MIGFERLMKRCGSRRVVGVLTMLIVAAAGAHGEGQTQPEIIDTPGEQEEIAPDCNSPRVSLGIEADIEITYEKQGSEKNREVTFDEVEISLEGQWWETKVGLKYESQGEKGVLVEEAVARFGGTECWPWFVQFGRTVLPFGGFSSRFIEDPLVAVVGETDEDAIVFGFENDIAEVSIGAFSARHHDIDAVASAKIMVLEDIEFGISLSSNLGESVEMREMQLEALREDEGGELAEDAVMGLGGFLAIRIDPFLVNVEYVTATESFDAGLLGEGQQKPSAWIAEIAVCPMEPWEIAARVEAAHDLPDNPGWQHGVATSYGLTESITLTVEYLYGRFDGDNDNRDLVAGKLAFEY